MLEYFPPLRNRKVLRLPLLLPPILNVWTQSHRCERGIRRTFAREGDEGFVGRGPV